MVMDVSTREAIHACQSDAVQIEFLAIEISQRGRNQSAIRLDRVAQREVVEPCNEIRELVIALKRMGQSVIAESEVESQPGRDVPVVIGITAIVVVDPVFACEELKLIVVRGVSKQEIDVRIAREIA